jgi:putative tryptophan/tyrosine transport system substrate-binding protein
VELKQTSHTVPIVFPSADDPLGTGLVESLAHPGGNATGFALNERGAAAECVELLKRIAPHTTRVAVIRNPTRGGGQANFSAIEAAASPLKVEVSAIDLRDDRAARRIGDDPSRRHHQACGSLHPAMSVAAMT